MLISESLLRTQLNEGQIYLFKNEISFGIPNHMHICLKNAGSTLYFVCCTTKKDTIVRFLDTRHITYSTLVGIEPDQINALHQTSYINCNSVKSCSWIDFTSQYNSGQIESIGTVGAEIFKLIIAGVQESPLIVREIKHVLMCQ